MALRLPVGGRDGAGVEAVLTRQQLEKLCAPLFKRMGKAVDEACWQVQCFFTTFCLPVPLTMAPLRYYF